MTTIDYYNTHAAEFVQATLGADMSGSYKPFLELVKPKGHILDLGCGSGRDSLAFKGLGYTVTAVDGSQELCKGASSLLEQQVLCQGFEELSFPPSTFDGIWCCASLLHVPKRNLPKLLQSLWAMLKPGGAMYASFKQGTGQRLDNGKLYTDLTVKEAQELFALLPKAKGVQTFTTRDVRPELTQVWVNIIAHR